MIYAALDGIQNKLVLPPPSDINLYRAEDDALATFRQLPKNFESACAAAANSDFIKRYIPQTILNIYCNQ